jgi:predicted RecB family nuclease
MQAERRLQDLISVGPAMLRDFEMLGIRSVKELARQEPKKMYGRLQRLTGAASGYLRVGYV